MGVDMVHLLGRDPGIGQGLLHGLTGPGRVGTGDHVVVGVAAGAAAGDLRVAVGRPMPGIGRALEHERDASLAQHEAVTIAIEGA